MNMKLIGDNIRQHRKIKGLTQEELAKESGLSTMSIRRYENGERIAPQDTLIKIASALNVEISDLFVVELEDIGYPKKFDKEYPHAGKEAADFEEFIKFLESIGYSLKIMPEGEEGETFTVKLSKDGMQTEFSIEGFENFRNETKKSVDYQVWQKSQEKK